MLIHLLNPIRGTPSKVFRQADTLDLLHPALFLREQFFFACNIVVRYRGDGYVQQEEDKCDDETGAVFSLRAMDQNAVVFGLCVCAKGLD
jgi:hypothetical protein